MDLLKVLSEIKPTDLEALDKQIAELEAELDKLKAVRRFAWVALNGTAKPSSTATTPRKNAAKPTGSADGQLQPGEAKRTGRPTLRVRCLRYLHASGRASLPALIKALAVDSKAAMEALDHIWFTKTDGGMYVLTAEGKSAVAGTPT